ncbi:glycoside hydrolase family 16 protein [Spirillospora sp. NPDC048819]|uniref:glycoside hydrolase family 16 protein n=1 Tax=Spirillospora sp. NPDC048819 TaxID=3155268 RepID=UPI003410EADE
MRGVARRIDRRRFLGMVAAAGAAGVMAAASSKASALGFDAERETMLPPGVGWRLDPAKTDEFDGGFLDTAKWVKEYRNDPMTQVKFADENAQVSDGLLRLRLGRNPSGKGPVHSGVVRSRFVIGADSYTEVRAKMTGTEANADSVIRHSGADVQHIGRAHGPLDDGFHIYGLERRAGKVVLYIDGKPYRSYRDPVEAADPKPLVMYVREINEKKRINAGALPMDMFVDHVRVYTA